MQHSSSPLSPLPAPPLPLLVTGIAGVAGYDAFRRLARRYPGQVVGARREDYWPLSGEGILAVDIENPDAVKRLFDDYRFAAVLHGAGSCKLKSCEMDPAMAWRVNVTSAEIIAREAAARGVRLVQLSIDLVFSGTAGGRHVETDPTDPVTVYGKTMVVAEEAVAREHPAACTLRISLPMGVSFNGHAGAIDWIASRFKHGRPATLYFDEFRTPAYASCLTALFQRVLANDMRGLYHAGGPRRLSLYQIAQIVSRVGGYDPRLLIGCPRREAGPLPPRAGDVSLCSDKLAAALGESPLSPWPLNDELVPDGPDWHFRRSPGERGSAEKIAHVLYRRPGCTGLRPAIETNAEGPVEAGTGSSSPPATGAGQSGRPSA